MGVFSKSGFGGRGPGVAVQQGFLVFRPAAGSQVAVA